MTPASTEYCFLWLNHWSTCMTKSEWSGWVQAVGSVLAIAGAGMLLYLQLRATKRQALEVEQRRLMRRHNAIQAVAMFCEMAIQRMCAAVRAQCQVGGSFKWIPERPGLELAHEELSNVRKAELESFHLVRATRRMAVCLNNALLIDDALRGHTSNDGRALTASYFANLDRQAQKASEEATKALAEVRDAINELMEDPNIALPQFV